LYFREIYQSTDIIKKILWKNSFFEENYLSIMLFITVYANFRPNFHHFCPDFHRFSPKIHRFSRVSPPMF